MNKILSFCLLLPTFYLFTNAEAADAADTTKSISSYLVDISASPVSAGDQVGLSGSAITNIQSAHDLTLAISPLATGSGKGGFGFAITPARTNIGALAVSYDDYIKGNAISRLYGSLSLSYAENTSDITGASYKKTALSISTDYYPTAADDPIIQKFNAFQNCKPAEDIEVAKAHYINRELMKIDSNNELSQAEKIAAKATVKSQAKDNVEKEAEAATNICFKKVDDSLKWNTTKLTFSAGSGWIKPITTAGTSQSLGNSLVIGGNYGIGADGGFTFTLRRTTGEVDLKTLATTPTFSSSTLAALRYTQGVGNDSTFRILAEVSNAKDSTTGASTSSNNVFKYAIGIDKKLSGGAWAELRFGRKRTEDGTDVQNVALFNLNWSPSSTLLSK